MGELIKIVIPGAADTRIADGDLWREQPELAARWKTQGKLRRSGRGYSWIVSLSREDWDEVAYYLASVEGATEAAARDNPGENESERAELRAIGIVLARIEQHLPEIKKYRW